MYFDNEKPIAQATSSEKLRLVDRLADGGVTKLSLLGGEPLTLGDELFALLRRAHERDISVTVVTNGVLMGPDVSRRLIDDGVANLVVSIESPQAEIHNQIRGKRTFERLMSNIDAFQQLRDGMRSPGLTVNTVLSRPNRLTFPDMIPFCQSIGADQWNALTLNYIGSADKNLDKLALSQREHTEVALEIGMRMKSGEFSMGDLKVNFTIVCPLVWEYLVKKYEIYLPQPEICCSAATSLVYMSPSGDVYLCDRVNSSGYVTAPLETTTMRPTNLLSHAFEEIWKGRQFTEMFEFVQRSETYARFEPCNHCKYLCDRTCNPCPLQSYKDGDIRYEECLMAEAYLGDISTRGEGLRTSWEEAHRFQPAPWPDLAPSWFDDVRNAYPVRMEGARCSRLPNDESLIMHPQSGEVIKINLMGRQIWDSITGSTTTHDVLAGAVDCYEAVGQALNIEVSANQSEEFGSTMVMPFIRLLQEKNLIAFMNQDGKRLRLCPMKPNNA